MSREETTGPPLPPKPSLPSAPPRPEVDDMDADLLLRIAHVRVDRVVSMETQTTEPVTEGSLEVIAAPGHGDDTSKTYFLRCGTFTIPLRPDVPSLRFEGHVYVFPMPGPVFFGVTLHPETPEATILAFEEILDAVSLFRRAVTEEEEEEIEGGEGEEGETEGALVPAGSVGPPSGPLATSDTTSRTAVVLQKTAVGVEKGSRLLAAGLVKGATLVGAGVVKGGGYLRKKIKPRAKPAEVDPKLQAKIRHTKTVTSGVVVVSASMVRAVLAMTASLADSLAAGFKATDTGKKVTQASGPKSAAAKKVGLASLKALENIWEGLAEAGKIVGTSIGTESSAFVHHRYGEDAGQLATEVVGVAGNVGHAALNVARLKPSSLAASTATQSAHHVLSGDENDGDTQGVGHASSSLTAL
eukprot:TRINITY_DN38681_c0_g1_i1.p1 TRINITY_DN38681_c0_g1~~TRINITY_DN38681_c0_g1_i1.p1  ORF type:complete len:413 (-),score=92.06 TRINITY_DN38681_c0_g1_i1:26-1264(-)